MPGSPDRREHTNYVGSGFHMKDSSLLLVLQRILKESHGRISVKLLHESEPTEWSPWAICPAPGYYEIDKSGPFRLQETEWFELQPPRLKEQIIHELDFPQSELNTEGSAIRIYP